MKTTVCVPCMIIKVPTFFLQNTEQQAQTISFSQMQHLLLLTEAAKKEDWGTQGRRLTEQDRFLEYAKREKRILSPFLLMASSHG